MPNDWVPQGIFLALVGLGVGLWLLARGLAGYREATRIGDTATSRISSIAAGEVQVSGVIEPAELTLVSPLQSVECVYYRSTVDGADDDGIDLTPALANLGADFHEERAVGFRVRDASGDLRVFPRAARWDAPMTLDDTTGLMGDEPPSLRIRTGPALAPTGLGRDAAIAALLATPPARSFDPLAILGGSAHRSLTSGDRRRRYREAILAPGDAITIIGRAMPFGDLADPAEADMATGSELASDDPEVAGDVAEAREAGLLEATPEEAWGNAAIPGFGVGQPVRAPELDPAANPLPVAPSTAAAEIERRFMIAPESLVLASAPGTPLLIASGIPTAAMDRRQGRFLIGLLGALLAIASAMALAFIVPGAFGA